MKLVTWLGWVLLYWTITLGLAWVLEQCGHPVDAGERRYFFLCILLYMVYSDLWDYKQSRAEGVGRG